MPPPRKQWYDKVADAILGDDEASGAGAASRYALICQKCFAHNGLVTESMWEDTRECRCSLSLSVCLDHALDRVRLPGSSMAIC